MSTTERLTRNRRRKQRHVATREEQLAHRRQRIVNERQRGLASIGASGLPRILRLPEVEGLTGKPRSAIYEEMATGSFPGTIALSERAVGWLESEVLAWIDQRVAARDAKKKAHRETELQT